MAILMPKTMAALNEERLPVYPLFQKPSKSRPLQVETEDSLSHPLGPGPPDVSTSTANPSEKGRNKSKNVARKANGGAGTGTEAGTDQIKTEGGSAELLEVDPNNGRRKRRKTTSPHEKSSSVKTSEAGSPSSHALPRETQIRPAEVNEFFSTTGKQEQAKPLDDESITKTTMVTKSILPNTASSPSGSRVAGSQQQYIQGEDEAPPQIQTPQAIEVDALVQTTKEVLSTVNGPSNTILPGFGPGKPKKILKLNPKTGTIGSPPVKNKSQLLDTVPKGRSKGRAKPLKSRIVVIQYGETSSISSAIGQKISSIMDGTATIPCFAEKQTTKPPKTTKIVGSGPIATPHPFFMPKAIMKDDPSKKAQIFKESAQGSEPTNSTSRRFSPKSIGEHLASDPKPKNLVSAFTGFGSSSGIVKYPGAIEPAWPWKGMIHLRGADLEEPMATRALSMSHPASRKSKYPAIEISANEDVIDILARELCIDNLWKDIRDINPDYYPPLPTCLRVPRKHFEAGSCLQQRVRKELRTWCPQQDLIDSEDDIKDKRGTAHPALVQTYASLATSLSAFDKSQCETQLWTQKYSPASAVEVLQPGREALILKEWLQNLTVIAVEGGSSDHPNTRDSSVSRKSATIKNENFGKRKRRSKKLEGFVISSDEEDDMDEISEPENTASPEGSQLLKRSVVRSVTSTATKPKDSTRLAHGVVISGPHGCGKSAAVHAVARELGFEVFEINSSSRRSGKDILEKVGDMTRNHLVQQSHTQVPAELVDEDAQRISDALDSDLISGRQGTMNSFLKVKDLTKGKPKAKKSTQGTANANDNDTNARPKAPPKKQKQSLILFEEVDVLYEEDKQFWATVMSLLIQSKRPVIMTCNDESAVPLQALSLHAILRFSPASVDVAADYMLLVAASEGHILRRGAVEGLYERKNQDLRASLTELNFWCQFAVGSSQGGLDWFYPRWPPGRDVDRYGKTIRVVSEGTYEAGMECLSQDFLESHINFLDIEEETLREAWDGWRLDAGDLSRISGLHQWADKMQNFSMSKKADRAALAMYDDLADSMSAADLCSAGELCVENQTSMDTTLPRLTSKAREDTILPYELIEAHPAINFSNLGKDISMFLRSRARKHFQVDQHVHNDLEIPAELDRPGESCILSLIKEQFTMPATSLRRHDLSLAFDPISEPEKTSIHSTETLEPSSFDRTMTLITTDLAPYVRSIVSYDARLQQERARLSNLLSEGGRRGKRMRTTRAAMSALEGGARNTTRKEKYFGPGLNPHFVLKTGCQTWLDAMRMETIRYGAADGASNSEEPTKAGSADERDELNDE